MHKNGWMMPALTPLWWAEQRELDLAGSWLTPLHRFRGQGRKAGVQVTAAGSKGKKIKLDHLFIFIHIFMVLIHSASRLKDSSGHLRNPRTIVTLKWVQSGVNNVNLTGPRAASHMPYASLQHALCRPHPVPNCPHAAPIRNQAALNRPHTSLKQPHAAAHRFPHGPSLRMCPRVGSRGCCPASNGEALRVSKREQWGCRCGQWSAGVGSGGQHRGADVGREAQR